MQRHQICGTGADRPGQGRRSQRGGSRRCDAIEPADRSRRNQGSTISASQSGGREGLSILSGHGGDLETAQPRSFAVRGLALVAFAFGTDQQSGAECDGKAGDVVFIEMHRCMIAHCARAARRRRSCQTGVRAGTAMSGEETR